MKGLSVAGTAAMFLVGGGILVHGVPALGHAVEAWAAPAGGLLGGLRPRWAPMRRSGSSPAASCWPGWKG